MKKNTLLKIAILLCKISKVFFILLFIGLTAVFVHLQLDRSFYSSKELDFRTKTGDYNYIYKWKVDTDEDFDNIFKFDEIKTSSLYMGYFQLSVILLVLFLSTREFQKVITSVEKFKTFGVTNVASFRRIGKYILIYAILTSYTSVSFQHGGFKGVSISFTTLFLALVAFIMAEIFKEGMLLKEENDLTI